jgi:hypothetical protein
MKKLNDDLQSIHNVMRKTIDDVLDRYAVIERTLYMLMKMIYCYLGDKNLMVSFSSNNLSFIYR